MKLVLPAVTLLTLATAAVAQQITPVWFEHLNANQGVAPANLLPILRKNLNKSENNNGTSEQVSFGKLLPYDATRLLLFVRACDQLYRLSVKGRQPAWVADLLDRGKPPALVDFQRRHGIAGEIPRVIRPDLILTDDGFTIAEIDSVPGGIGLTAWLNRTYAALGHDVLGGAEGLLEGFARIVPGGDIVVSEEASTYRPEMEWLARELNAGFPEVGHWRVLDASVRTDWQKTIYRFFELFDLENIRTEKFIFESWRAGEVAIAPPMRPFQEEKLTLALFHHPRLQDYWAEALSGPALKLLRALIPNPAIGNWNLRTVGGNPAAAGASGLVGVAKTGLTPR